MPLKARRSSRNNSAAEGGMTDISFLLIIFFLVALVVVVEDGIAINLPEQESEPEQIEKVRIIKISFVEGGGFNIEGEVVSSLEEVTERGSRLISNVESPIAIIEPLGDASYQEVLEVLEAIKKSGVNRYSINMAGGEAEPIPIKLEGESL